MASRDVGFPSFGSVGMESVSVLPILPSQSLRYVVISAAVLSASPRGISPALGASGCRAQLPIGPSSKHCGCQNFAKPIAQKAPRSRLLLLFANLLAQVTLVPDLLDLVELRFKPIDVALFVFEQPLKETARCVVACSGRHLDRCVVPGNRADDFVRYLKNSFDPIKAARSVNCGPATPPAARA